MVGDGARDKEGESDDDGARRTDKNEEGKRKGLS